MKQYERIPHITQLIHVEPFKMVCRWSTDEVRVHDFENQLGDWKRNQFLAPLTDFQTFQHVSVSETGTLQWESLVYTGPDGHVTPLDLDPIVLYETSKPLSAYRLVPVEQAA